MKEKEIRELMRELEKVLGIPCQYLNNAEMKKYLKRRYGRG